MIKAILVFNNHGKPRLSKFYQYFNEDMQQQIIKETFQLVSKRDDNVCNFLEGGSLIGGSDYKLIYRHYATLYFVFCVDSSESELGILDLIQVFVETLDKCFENVCELDLIFHADAVHHILAELVMGGMVLQTNMSDILARIEEQNKLVKQEAGLSAAPARAVSAVKSMNIPQQIKDIKLPDFPQAIKDLKFCPGHSGFDNAVLHRFASSSQNVYLPIDSTISSSAFNYDYYQSQTPMDYEKSNLSSSSMMQLSQVKRTFGPSSKSSSHPLGFFDSAEQSEPLRSSLSSDFTTHPQSLASSSSLSANQDLNSPMSMLGINNTNADGTNIYKKYT